MFIHSRLTQHVSGIIMPIVRRTDCIKPRVVLLVSSVSSFFSYINDARSNEPEADKHYVYQ